MDKSLNDFIRQANGISGGNVKVKEAYTDGKNYLLVMYNDGAIGAVCLICYPDSGKIEGITPIDPKIKLFSKRIKL